MPRSLSAGVVGYRPVAAACALGTCGTSSLPAAQATLAPGSGGEALRARREVCTFRVTSVTSAAAVAGGAVAPRLAAGASGGGPWLVVCLDDRLLLPLPGLAGDAVLRGALPGAGELELWRVANVELDGKRRTLTLRFRGDAGPLALPQLAGAEDSGRSRGGLMAMSMVLHSAEDLAAVKQSALPLLMRAVMQGTAAVGWSAKAQGMAGSRDFANGPALVWSFA